MSGAHADPPEAAKYTGLKKIFNAETFRGRANVSHFCYIRTIRLHINRLLSEAYFLFFFFFRLPWPPMLVSDSL